MIESKFIPPTVVEYSIHVHEENSLRRLSERINLGKILKNLGLKRLLLEHPFSEQYKGNNIAASIISGVEYSLAMTNKNEILSSSSYGHVGVKMVGSKDDPLFNAAKNVFNDWYNARATKTN